MLSAKAVFSLVMLTGIREKEPALKGPLVVCTKEKAQSWRKHQILQLCVWVSQAAY